MIRFKNVAYESVSGGAADFTTTVIRPLWVNNFKFPVKVRKCTFQITEKGSAGGTSFTTDITKNGTTILSTVPVATRGSLGTNYTVKYDTAKELTASAPTGISALPVLSSTDATITVKPGDALEVLATCVGTYSGTLPRFNVTVLLEYVPA